MIVSGQVWSRKGVKLRTVFLKLPYKLEEKLFLWGSVAKQGFWFLYDASVTYLGFFVKASFHRKFDNKYCDLITNIVIW